MPGFSVSTGGSAVAVPPLDSGLQQPARLAQPLELGVAAWRGRRELRGCGEPLGKLRCVGYF